MEHWSVEDYKNYTENDGKKRAKYRSYKTSIDGHTFDSLKEAEYYCELKNRLRAKDIRGFCIQPAKLMKNDRKTFPICFVFFAPCHRAPIKSKQMSKTRERFGHIMEKTYLC